MYYWDEIRAAGKVEHSCPEREGECDWSVTAPCGCIWDVFVAGYNGVTGSNYTPCKGHDPEQGNAPHPIERLYALYGGPLEPSNHCKEIQVRCGSETWGEDDY